jgi:hypothetical protein
MRRFRFAFALLLASLPARSAWSGERTDTCVEVDAPSDREALRTLIESELDRHPSHHAVREGCVSYLRIELIELEGERFLTARINEQVPERVRVGAGGVEAAVSNLLTVVLHNDPVRLRGPLSKNWLGEQREAFVKGQNQLSIESFELFTLLDGRLQTLPGFVISGRREAPRWFLGVRLAAAVSPSSGEAVALTSYVSAAAEGALFSHPSAETSLFGSLLLGVELERFSGPAPFLGEGARGTAVGMGFSPGVRGGVELLRLSEIRLAFSLEARLPVFLSDDPDGGVMRDAWMPSAALAGGLVF